MFRIAGYFRALGWQVTMITTEEPGEWFDRIAEHGLVGHHISGLRKFNFKTHAKAVGQALAQGRHDVVFTVFDRFSQASLSYLDGSCLVVPLLRNDHPEVYEIGLASSRYWNVAVGNSPKVCESARAILQDKPIFLIPNGVDAKACHPWPMRRWDQAEVLNLLFVGRLVHESKRVLLLPEMMQTIKACGIPARLKIVGDGPDRDALRQKIIEHGVADNCEVLGQLEESALKQHYAMAHALIFCSAYEGLPNILLEAMSQGCIPIATRLEGITDFLISDGQDGFLVPIDDAKALAQAAVRLTTSGVGERMSLQARSKVAQQFSTQCEADKFMALIEQHRQGAFCPHTPRRAEVDSSLFPLRYAFRRSIRPHLVAVYKLLRKVCKTRRQGASLA